VSIPSADAPDPSTAARSSVVKSITSLASTALEKYDIFDNIDDRDRGACAFLGEVLQSWDRRRCFSKRWLQDAAAKFSMPRGANPERDEGRGWYALTAENLHKKPPAEVSVSEDIPRDDGRRERDRDRDRDRDREAKEYSRKERDRRSRSPRKASRSPRKASRSPRKAKEREVRESREERSSRKDEERSGRKDDNRKDGRADRERPAESEVPKANIATPEKDGIKPVVEVAAGDGVADAAAKKKRRIVQNDEEDDDTVAKHLEDSRKRRAALMAKYQGGD